MPTNPQRLDCQVVNEHGLHVRTAAIIVTLCEAYDADVVIHSEFASSEANDMLRLLMLQASKGSKLTLEATGRQASEALDALKKLIESGFVVE